jgi:hypothetical protein
MAEFDESPPLHFQKLVTELPVFGRPSGARIRREPAPVRPVAGLLSFWLCRSVDRPTFKIEPTSIEVPCFFWLPLNLRLSPAD